MTGNNPNLDHVNINVNIKFGQILSIRSQTVYLNDILTSVNDHSSITNVRKMICNNPNNQCQCIYNIFKILSIMFSRY